MDAQNAVDPGQDSEAASERFFTVETANHALVLVRQVVGDAVRVYRELMGLRSARQELSLLAGAEERVSELNARIEQRMERLKSLHRELNDVGCQMKDFGEGLVDFPAWLDGRKVLLCWKLDEPQVSHWHEWRAGFAGRQPIDDEFRARVGEPRAIEAEDSASP